MKKPFVISVSGISGSGKTTVINALKEHLPDNAVISFDDYGDEVYLDRDINEWSADGNDENEWYVDPIVVDIEKLLKEPLQHILIDYPFGRRNSCIGKYIDYAVFVDTPLDIALARRIIRDYTNRSSERHKIKVGLSAIETELRHYLTTSRPTYERMPDTQKTSSDLVVDGAKTPEEIVDEIIKAINIADETDEERQARIYPIILTEYNPAWPQWFKQERDNLMRLIGDSIVRIQHIGSTAVPGLMAKPTVDILLEVPVGTDFDKIVAVFSSYPEYICLYPPTNPEPLCILKGYTDTGFAEKVYHIHVREVGEYDEPIFRDYLIAHTETAAEYAALKHKLFKNYKHDRDGYTNAKGDFIKSVTKKAQEVKP